MPSLDEVLSDVGANPNGVIDLKRHEYINKLAAHRGRNVICYYSGWLQHMDGDPVDSLTDTDMTGFMTNVHGLDRGKGLDLVLHTPGGSLSAVESIVNYLHDCFGGDIVAFVPQLCMSAGTMIACACKEIYMGRQSSIGPTDPQFGGVPVGGVIEEFDRAVEETTKNPASIPIWSQIIGKYPPTFLGECQKTLNMSQTIVEEWLSGNMLKEDPAKAKEIAVWLGTHKDSAMHDRHISIRTAKEHGLIVKELESDNDLQDIVLTIHHTYMLSFERSTARKMIENSDNKSWIKKAPEQIAA